MTSAKTSSFITAVTGSWVLRFLSVLLVLGLWEWTGRVPISPAFPSFSQTMAAFGQMLVDGTFLGAYAQTIQPLAVGLLLTSLDGVFAGILLGLSPRAEWFGLPVFIVLQASPSAAIVPLITFIYGIGFAAKVFAVVLLSAPVIVLNSYRGITNTPRSLLEMGDAFLASRWQRIWKIVLPAGSGLIFARLRLGLAQGFTGAVLAELIITPRASATSLPSTGRRPRTRTCSPRYSPSSCSPASASPCSSASNSASSAPK